MTIGKPLVALASFVALLALRSTAAEPAPAAPAPAAAAPAPTLRQILISDTIESAQQLQEVPAGGFVVIRGETLAKSPREELLKALKDGEGQPISEQLLVAVLRVVETFFRQRDFPGAVAVVPPQTISGGVVRIAVVPARIRNVTFTGNRWFSESLLREKLRVERGEMVRVSELDRNISWLNTNPFRQVRAQLAEVPNSTDVDLVIGVQEQRPYRFALSYDNTGNEILGESHYIAGISAGNVWGRDHLLSYQFITSDDPSIFRAHAFDYRAPLPWRHVVSLSGSFLEANPTFLEGLFEQKAKSITADLKYVIPFQLRSWRGEATGTVSFRHTNNDLQFGGSSVLGTPTDLLTGRIAAGGIREDKRGRWLVSGSLVASPGQFNSRSSERAYGESRLGANPRFIYTQWILERAQRLTPKLTGIVRSGFQASSTNLLSSEQLSLGGLASIRGYRESILTGDHGFTLTTEAQHRFPSFPIHKRLPKVDFTGIAFVDYGRIYIKEPLGSQRRTDYLASAGVGIRASVSTYCNLSVDAARQIEEVEIPGEPRHRVHVRVTFTY